MTAYYNEHDPFAAAWLRELIKAGHIAPGIVDERSIEDVRPWELFQYTQCHFFAGIGGWSLALRQAGWPDDRPVWTGSCPCQPFSAAGKGAGFDDERHLWPSFQWLIEQCRPPAVFGEQVASKATDPWIDLVQLDLEALGYAFGAVAFPAASVGAPHIRDRTYWVGHRLGQGLEGHAGHGDGSDGWAHSAGSVAQAGGTGGLADAPTTGHQRRRSSEAGDGRDAARIKPERLCDAEWVAEPMHTERRALDVNGQDGRDGSDIGRQETHSESGARGEVCERPGPTNGFWRDADWLLCRDGRWRPVEPGTFPLAHGVPSRVGRLRGYGNAIAVPQAAEFIAAVMV